MDKIIEPFYILLAILKHFKNYGPEEQTILTGAGNGKRGLLARHS